MATYNIYEAKTSFSRLVAEATSGKEVVIAKSGKPVLRLVPIVKEKTRSRRVFGQNVMGLGKIDPAFYEDLPLDMWEVLKNNDADWPTPPVSEAKVDDPR